MNSEHHNTPKFFAIKVYGLGCPEGGVETQAYIHEQQLFIGSGSGFRPVTLNKLKIYQQEHEFLLEWKQLNEGYTASLPLAPSDEDLGHGWTEDSWFELLAILSHPERSRAEAESRNLTKLALLTAAGVSFALVLTFFLAFDTITDKVTTSLSQEDEQEIGSAIWSQSQGQFSFIQDRKANQVLAEILGIIESAQPSGRKYRIYINDSPEVKTYNLPGGYIIINRGLLEQCQNANELAGVIAHEIAHAQSNHTLRNLVELQGSKLALDLLSNSLNAALIKTGLKEINKLKYSVVQDESADAIAAIRLKLAQIDPNHFAYLFERLARGTFNVTPDLLIDHPNNKQREIQLSYNNMKWNDLVYDWNEVIESLNQPSNAEEKLGQVEPSINQTPHSPTIPMKD